MPQQTMGGVPAAGGSLAADPAPAVILQPDMAAGSMARTGGLGPMAPAHTAAAQHALPPNALPFRPQPQNRLALSMEGALPKPGVMSVPSNNVLALSQINLVSRQYQGHPVLLQTGAHHGQSRCFGRFAAC